MFFMVTYGALCAISFLQHFAALPSYRPSFRSRWYVSLLGAFMSLFLMFQMDPLFALLALVVMVALYLGIRSGQSGRGDLAAMFQGVITQATRHSHIQLQRSARSLSDEWRPSVIMISAQADERAAPQELLKWLCHRHGFGTYLQFVKGQLNPETYKESRKILARLIQKTHSRNSDLFVDTMVSPSMRTALAQSLQVPGVSGMENNTALFEFSQHDGPEARDEAASGSKLASTVQMNSLVLRHGEHFFGGRRLLNVWLTWHDQRNTNLMILLAYVILGHPDWEDAEVRIFAAFPEAEIADRQVEAREMIASGRLPVSAKGIRMIGTDDQVDFERLVATRSATADLTLLGFTQERLAEKGPSLFERHPSLREVLWVCAEQQLQIS
jgi:hypothetical protein